MPALMFENPRIVLSDQRLKTMLVAGVFELSALRGRRHIRRTWRRFQSGPTLNQALSEIRRDIWSLDVETDLTLWCIGSRVRRRPLQTGDHKMIIIPKQKLSMQFAIMNLHEPDTVGAGESLEFGCVLSAHKP
jgi:hypothetical protein